MTIKHCWRLYKKGNILKWNNQFCSKLAHIKMYDMKIMFGNGECFLKRFANWKPIMDLKCQISDTLLNCKASFFILANFIQTFDVRTITEAFQNCPAPEDMKKGFQNDSSVPTHINSGSQLNYYFTIKNIFVLGGESFLFFPTCERRCYLSFRWKIWLLQAWFFKTFEHTD